MRKAIWLCLGDVVRESEVRMMNARNARREMLIIKQWEFLESRQRALESVLGGLNLLDRILMLVGFKMLKEEVDRVHMEMLREAERVREEMVRKVKEDARKPKLIIPNREGVNNGRV